MPINDPVPGPKPNILFVIVDDAIPNRIPHLESTMPPGSSRLDVDAALGSLAMNPRASFRSG
jgi:hypothetical protein